MDSEILNKFLVGMGDMLKEAKDFSLEQLPIVAKEILQYNLAVDLAWLGFALLIVLASLVVAIWFTRLIRAEGPRGMENYWGMYMIPGLMCLISFLITVNEGRDALMIWLAPRVYLLEYIARLLHHSH